MISSHRRALAGLIAAALATSLCFVLAISAAAEPPTLTLTADDATIGGTIEATAQLSESPDASGEISFEVFGPDDPTCSGPALEPAPASATVEGEGEYVSGEFTPAGAGTYRWSAHYSGDLNNPAADSNCSALSTVAKATPGLTGEASPGVVGAAIDDEATISGGFSPTGEVTFTAYGPTDTECSTPLGSSTTPLEGGSAISADFFPQQAGEFRWRAFYLGDDDNEATSTACDAGGQTSVVAKATPVLSATATTAVTVGQTITDDATVSGGFQAGGQLVFRAYGPDDATCATTPKYEATVAVNGNGSYSPAGFSPGPGLYRWTVSYGGDANNEATSTACGAADQSSAVSKASPTLSGTATSAGVGQPIHDGASLAGAFSPTGEVTFRVYGPSDTTCSTPLATTSAPISGGAATSPNYVPQQAGGFRWRASYPGDANNESASTACNATGQTSVVAKATPGVDGTATSVVKVGQPITDNATVSGGFQAGGQLVFRAYGPDDATCATTPKYEATVAVNGNGSYSPAGFSPGPGLYRWTVSYGGDANNEATSTACDAANQGSAVGTISPTLTATATGGTVGDAVDATATIQQGAIPSGQITFKAFSPGDTSCSGTPAFSSTVSVAGNGSYRSAAFTPARVGTFRWTVAYSGDPNHAPTAVGCGKAASSIGKAAPSIAGKVSRRLPVGTAFRDTATLQGGFSPAGTITFRIYGPVAGGCDRPLFVNTVAVNGNGTFSSDPFVAQRPGRYSFVASYSGDAANQGATEPCDSADQVANVQKRTPQVRPRAILMKGKRIAIRANLTGGASPSGAISFRLYGPDDRRCKRKPAFSGGISVKSNGSYTLAQYLATRSGVYRLSVGYSGDPRNRRYKGTCRSAQPIRVG